MCLRPTRYYSEAGEEESKEAGVWERIRGRAEASVIYTWLSAKDTPLSVIHAAHTKPLEPAWTEGAANSR